MTLSEDTSYQIVGAQQRDEPRDPESRHQWDINDNVLPTPAELEDYQDWPNGHCRYVYPEGSEEARRHSSGWAMRNTNNHNVNILKKSCLGVLVCNMSCVSDKGETIHLRPAICDKARKKQIGRQCSNPRCPGKLELQPCRGHCGYPVTHFWRHTNGVVYFQAKGVHDHAFPEIKASAEARRHTHSSKENKLKLSDARRTPRKRMWLDPETLSRLYKVPKLEQSALIHQAVSCLQGHRCSTCHGDLSRYHHCINQSLTGFKQAGNDVICSCPPFECLCSTYHGQLPQNGGILPTMQPMLARQKHIYDGDFQPHDLRIPHPQFGDFKQESMTSESLLPGYETPVSLMANIYLTGSKSQSLMGHSDYPPTCQNDCMFTDSLPISVTSSSLSSSAVNAMQCANLTRDLSGSPRDFVDGTMRLPTTLVDNHVSNMPQGFCNPKMSTNISQMEQNEHKIDSQKAFGNLLSQSDAGVLDLNLPSITAFFRDENEDKTLDDSFNVPKDDAQDLSYNCMDQKTPALSPISDHRATPTSQPSSPVSLTELKPMNDAEKQFRQFQKYPQQQYQNDSLQPQDVVDGMNHSKHAFQPYIAETFCAPYPPQNCYGGIKQDVVRSHPNVNDTYSPNQTFYPSPTPSIAQRLPAIVPHANINISFAYQ